MNEHFDLIRSENHCHLDRFWDFVSTLKETIGEMEIELEASVNTIEAGELRQGSETHCNLRSMISNLKAIAEDIEYENPTRQPITEKPEPARAIDINPALHHKTDIVKIAEDIFMNGNAPLRALSKTDNPEQYEKLDALKVKIQETKPEWKF